MVGPCMKDYVYAPVPCVAFPVTVRKSEEAASAYIYNKYTV